MTHWHHARVLDSKQRLIGCELIPDTLVVLKLVPSTTILNAPTPTPTAEVECLQLPPSKGSALCRHRHWRSVEILGERVGTGGTSAAAGTGTFLVITLGFACGLLLLLLPLLLLLLLLLLAFALAPLRRIGVRGHSLIILLPLLLPLLLLLQIFLAVCLSSCRIALL
jgi:hypothetical protein